MITSHTADFVVVANRLAVDRVVDDQGVQGWRTSPGGLVTALEPIVASSGGAWVGWPGSPDEDLAPFEHDGMTLVPVPLTAGQVENYYEGLSNATLWPLYHDGVAFPEFHRHWWRSYREVNELFAARTADVAAPGATVWVQDYQLQLVPQMLRDRRPDLTIGFFLHIPFPPQELFAQLPWRNLVLEGLVGADLVGFQVPQGAENFRQLVHRFLGYEIDGDAIVLPDGRRTTARAYPISIDTQSFHDAALSDDVRDAARQFVADLGEPKRVFLGVDRLDYTKGLLHRIRAFGELFTEGLLNPEEDVFVQVASPSREAVGEYMKLRDDIELLVGRINGDIGRIGTPPILYLYNSYPRSMMAAMYTVADVMVVTPLRDGMNLVAKEYVACRTDGTGSLVLSEFAGAAKELEAAYLVNPYDVDGMKNKIMLAANSTVDEQRLRMQSLRDQVFAHDVDAWAASFLKDLRASVNSV